MTAMAIETDLRASLDELARACRILEMEGHGDMTLGHLSLRDHQRRGFWLKRNRIGLGEVLGADDFVLVDWDGRQLAGSGGRHSEWPIHSEILRLRGDVEVVFGGRHRQIGAVLTGGVAAHVVPAELDGEIRIIIDGARRDASRRRMKGAARLHDLADDRKEGR